MPPSRLSQRHEGPRNDQPGENATIQFREPVVLSKREDAQAIVANIRLLGSELRSERIKKNNQRFQHIRTTRKWTT
jgi:hypothetical protein